MQDLVKSHLLFAVREEVEVLKEQIKILLEKNDLLQEENAALKQRLQASTAPPPQGGNPAPGLAMANAPQQPTLTQSHQGMPSQVRDSKHSFIAAGASAGFVSQRS